MHLFLACGLFPVAPVSALRFQAATPEDSLSALVQVFVALAPGFDLQILECLSFPKIGKKGKLVETQLGLHQILLVIKEELYIGDGSS